jgi:Domain of unknown function (DUF4942)
MQIDCCEIISLFNADTLHNLRYDKREIKHVIDTYGNSYELGNCFATAERRTNVNISCIKLYKPFLTDSVEFEGFYMDAEPDTIQTDGIVKFNEIQALVNAYISASRCFDEFTVINEKMKMFCSPIGLDEGFIMNLQYDKKTANKSEFLIEYQRRSWRKIFHKMKLDKYLTSGVLKDINKFIETQTKIPFTVRNVYRMLEIIVGTQEQTFNNALVEAIDNFTQHTHENRYGVEGWKTNAGHLLNKKFISGWICESNYSKGIGIKQYNGNFEKILDLTKVLCSLTGTDFYKVEKISFVTVPKDEEDNYIKDGYSNYKNENTFDPNTWYNWGFFEFKLFKKGTGHFKFKCEKTWELMNRRYSAIKGQLLPEKI